MIRIILVNLLLLLLPLIIYFAYVYFRGRSEPATDIVADAPIFWLLSGGALLVVIALMFLVHWDAAEPDAKYIPPRYQDGVIVPGHYERAE